MIDFNVREYFEDKIGEYKPLPKGEYNARVLSVEIKDTKKTSEGNDTSRYLLVKHEVLDGKYLGRQLYNNFNIWHSSEKAREIGRKQFASLCGAVDMLELKEVGKLFNTRQVIVVDIEESEKYGNRNKILFYKPYKVTEIISNETVTPDFLEADEEIPF